MDNSINRRQFVGGCSAGALALAAQRAQSNLQDNWPPKMPKVKIHQVYVGRTGGIYLSRPQSEIGRFEDHLKSVEHQLGDVEFVGGEIVPQTNVDEILPKIKQADGVLMFHLSGHGGGAPAQAMKKILETGVQATVFSQPFSGHGWMYFPRWQQAGHKVILAPSSDWGEIDRAVKLMRVAPHMKNTRILVIRGPLGTEAACSAEKVKAALGCELVAVSVEETLNEHKAVSLKDAEAEAEAYWLGQAKNVVEPTRDEIINAARFYLAIKNIMQRENAQAVTSSNCMGEPAKGCFAFSKLNDLGMVGACEGDMDSTLTMLMFAYGMGLPGFISDPVIDTAKDALVHFHCTSATKMGGRDSERLPFTIRNQSDSESGVALDVEFPIGQMTTCAKYINLDSMLISTGKVFDVTHDELGCRTQFWVEVDNARGMFDNWGGGVLDGGAMTMLHRVVCYGDQRQNLKDLSHLMGFKVIEET